MNDRRPREPFDDGSSVASWTRDEKRRAMRSTEAHEESLIFRAKLRRIGVTIAAVMASLLALKQLVGQGWSDFIAFLGGSSPK